MLRIRGDRDSLITALVSRWLDQTLQLPATGTIHVSTSGAPKGTTTSRSSNFSRN